MVKTRMWVQTEGSFLILLALMLLILPFQWILAAIVAGLFHECCHYWAIRIMKGHVYGVRLGFGGAKMEVEPMEPPKELIAAVAGPFGSALLVLLAKWMPRLAVCGLCHCLFNLLPLFPMDGGRVLRSAIRLFLPREKANRIFEIIQHFLALGIGIGCVIATFKWGLPIAIVGFWVIWRRIRKRTV